MGWNGQNWSRDPNRPNRQSYGARMSRKARRARERAEAAAESAAVEGHASSSSVSGGLQGQEFVPMSSSGTMPFLISRFFFGSRGMNGLLFQGAWRREVALT